MHANAIFVRRGCSQFAFFFFYERVAALAHKLASNRKALTLSQDLCVGFIAGALNTILTNPLWVAATRMKLADGDDDGEAAATAPTESSDQPAIPANGKSSSAAGNVDDYDDGSGGSIGGFDADGKKRAKDFVPTLVEVIRSGGAWKGLGAGVLLCTNPAINYGLFEQMKKLLIKLSKTREGGTLNAGPAFLAGVVAKTVATVLTYPLQLVQVHSQKSLVPGGFSVSAQALIQQHGWDLPEYVRVRARVRA